REDEDCIIRCYEEIEPNMDEGGKIDFDAVLSQDFDVLLVESYRSLPYRDVEKLVRKVDAKKVLIVHNGGLDDSLRLPINIFDAVVVFDERYVREVIGRWDKRIHIIPYPCYPVENAEKRKPSFADGKFLFFSFGRQPVNEYRDFVKALADLKSQYDLLYWVIRSDGPIPFNEPWILQERKRLEIDELYRCLHAADVHLLPKSPVPYVVVSSTLYMCLGSLCPTVVPDTRHFETLPSGNNSPVIKYQDVEDLKNKLIKLLEEDNYRQEVVSAAEKYVKANSVEVVAEKFINLFNELLASQTYSCPA
ncbi:glycosyltransferase family 1 protein, partial [Candidatus Bathyarchaeota archaeon]|nr:glycosyltransferase family 1 protein [Candidatus Bathyarchaeota archaeon]